MSWELVPEQVAALELVRKRMGDGESETVVTGHAGVGKTKMLSQAPKLLGIDPEQMVVVAPTNKAVQNVKDKMWADEVYCQVVTVYQLLYPGPDVQHCSDCLKENGGEPCIHNAARKCRCGELLWTPRDSNDGWDLIVCDESSMVKHSLHADMADLQSPKLYIGDPGQLPPVEKENRYKGFSVLDPNRVNFTLREVHRQAKGSPILQVATEARMGKPFRSGAYGDGPRPGVRVCRNTLERRERLFTKDPGRVFLAWRHKTLTANNMRARDVLGLRGVVAEGDRLLCKTNLHKEGVYNGTMGTVQEVTKMPGGHHLVTIKIDITGRLWEGYIDVFSSRDDRISDITRRLPNNDSLSVWRYGYCLTVHEAQGSEWRSVVIIDSPEYRERHRSEYAKWAYTATTRAKKRLMVLV